MNWLIGTIFVAALAYWCGRMHGWHRGHEQYGQDHRRSIRDFMR